VKNHFVSELREGARVEDVFVVASKSVLRTRAGQPYIKMQLGDRTGAIDAVKWHATPSELEGVSELDFVFVRGKVGEYNGQPQLTVESFYRYSETVDPADFLPTTSRDVDEMASELREILARVQNPHLVRLLASFFDDERIGGLFRQAPAATKVHHACIGGLLEHTLGVVKSCAALAELYPEADRDLLVTAAALHDIGKIEEFDWSIAIRYSDAGQLVGHVVGGAMMVREAAEHIEGFDPLVSLALQHAILAHHGQREFGSPQEPKSIEAMIVHAADQLDADIAMLLGAIAESEREGSDDLFTKRHHWLDRHLFKGFPKPGEPSELAFDSDSLAAETDYDPFAEE
jgi:3'-5' exoribonuclease